MSRKKTISTVVIGTLGAMMLAACSSNGGAPAASSAAAAETSGTTAASACAQYGNITLTVGYSEAGEAIESGFKSLATAFSQANPNVKVDVQAKDWTSSQQTIRLAMSSNNPPDVIQGNEGWSIDGVLWQAKLIANLDPYAKKYGWTDKFPESALTVNRFSADGKQLGTGNLVALPQALQYVGVFYNKGLLAQIGITDPTTLDNKTAFLAALDKAKAAGLLPVMLGDSDKWPALHILSLFNGWYENPDTINKWVFNTAGTTYDTPGRLKASTDFQDWMKSGYFNKDALATSFADATSRFGKGESAFFITGTWALGDVSKALGGKAGFMLFPAGDTGKHEAVGGYSLPFAMSSKTKYPDCAADFINFITTSDQAIQAQIAAGRPSATKSGLDAKVTDPLLAQMISEYKRLNADSGLFNWEDWPTPTMLTYSGQEAQKLLSGELTPQAYNTEIQKNWSDYMATRG